MRFSGLAVAVILLLSSVVVAQHSSGGSSGGSHSSYSGGGSSSGGSATHSARSGSSASHSSHQPSGSNAAPAIRESGVARVPSQPEKRVFFSFLRHPFRKPKTEADLQRGICSKKGPCPVCPAGQTAGKNGACVPSPQAFLCRTGEYWNNGGCVGFVTFLANCSLDPDGELMAARKKMEAATRSMEAVCSQDPAGHECSEENVLYQSAVDLYRQRQESHVRAYEECQPSWFFFSPFGLSYGPLFSPLALYSDPLLP